MRNLILTVLTVFLGLEMGKMAFAEEKPEPARRASQTDAKPLTMTMSPIGWVRKPEGKTLIVLDKKYQPGLMGLEQFSHVWVLWWFDRNDTPGKRAILQVHPRGNPANPKRGVFATHSPVRPNLIGMTRCRILSVKENVVEIDGIDAFDDTPVLDLKN